ncbi:MAG: MFS transporter [Chitinivibrionales bacterium]|nr:MFS transporter [Chitinivibrionales bacterium]
MNEHQDKRVAQSLRFSFFDGIFASCMVGFSQDFYTPLILLVGASTQAVGLLSALPSLFSSISQLFTAKAVNSFHSRRRFLKGVIFLQVLSILSLAIAVQCGKCTPGVVIALVTLITVCGAFPGPAWMSLMSDLIPQQSRGEYFGWRGRVLGFITISASLIAGSIIYVSKQTQPNNLTGFVIIFTVAFLCRLASWHFLVRMHDPNEEAISSHDTSIHIPFRQLWQRVRCSNSSRFLLFGVLMHFSIAAASPFFSVFMLRDLHYNYLMYTIMIGAMNCALFINYKRWGLHIDKIGSVAVFRLTSRMIALLPFLWIFYHHPVYIFLLQILGGFIWAGYSLASTNFIYDLCPPQRRTLYISLMNTSNGIASFFGALFGGFCAMHVPAIFNNQLLTVFLLSAVMRCIVAFFCHCNVRDVRAVQPVSNSRLILSMLRIAPLPFVQRNLLNYTGK